MQEPYAFENRPTFLPDVFDAARREMMGEAPEQSLRSSDGHLSPASITQRIGIPMRRDQSPHRSYTMVELAPEFFGPRQAQVAVTLPDVMPGLFGRASGTPVDEPPWHLWGPETEVPEAPLAPPIPTGSPWEWKTGGDEFLEDPETGGFDRGTLPYDVDETVALVGLPCRVTQRIRFRTSFAFSSTFQFYASYDDTNMGAGANPNSLVGKFAVEVLDLINAGTYGMLEGYFRGSLPAFITPEKVRATIVAVFKRHYYCPPQCKTMRLRVLAYRVKRANPKVTYTITNTLTQFLYSDYQMVNDPTWGWTRVPVRSYYRHHLKMDLRLTVTLDLSAKLVVRCT